MTATGRNGGQTRRSTTGRTATSGETGCGRHRPTGRAVASRCQRLAKGASAARGFRGTNEGARPALPARCKGLHLAAATALAPLIGRAHWVKPLRHGSILLVRSATRAYPSKRLSQIVGRLSAWRTNDGPAPPSNSDERRLQGDAVRRPQRHPSSRPRAPAVNGLGTPLFLSPLLRTDPYKSKGKGEARECMHERERSKGRGRETKSRQIEGREGGRRAAVHCAGARRKCKVLGTGR